MSTKLAPHHGREGGKEKLLLPGLRQLTASLVHTQRHPSLRGIFGEMTPRGIKQGSSHGHTFGGLSRSISLLGPPRPGSLLRVSFSGSPQLGMPLQRDEHAKSRLTSNK